MNSVSGIIQTASAISQAQTSNKIDMAVLVKHQEATKQTGDAMVQLIQAAVDTGKQLDIRG